ncbi:hypothetical protein Tco_0227994 [Tanacetum coccineum]
MYEMAPVPAGDPLLPSPNHRHHYHHYISFRREMIRLLYLNDYEKGIRYSCDPEDHGVQSSLNAYGLLRMLRGRQSLLTPNFPKVNHSMLERSTGIAGVTKEARTSQSRTASPLRRQGPAGQKQLVSSGGKDQPTSGPQQVLEHEDNFDPEDKGEVKRCEMVLDTKLVKHHTECNPERAFLHNNDPMVLAVGKAFDELRETKAKFNKEVCHLREANI